MKFSLHATVGRYEALAKIFKSAYFCETKNVNVDYIMPNF